MSESPASVFKTVSSKDAKAGSFMVVELDSKKKLTLSSHGEGLEALKKALDDAKCMWVCYNVHGVDVRANVESVRTKLVQINWVGEKVPAMKKMNALAGKTAVSKLFKGVAVTIDRTKTDDISTKDIVDALASAGGAHKPTYYGFGCGEKVDLEFYDPVNK